MKNLTFSLRVSFHLVGGFLMCGIAAGERPEAAGLVGELRERLNETGSFRVEYTSMSNSARDVEIVHDAENLRTVLRMTGENGDFIIAETLRMSEKEELQVRFFDGTAGQMVRFSTADFEVAVENSVRALMSVLALFFDEVTDETERLSAGIAEQLTFEVSEEAASVSLGWHVSSTARVGLDVSWLDEDLFREVSELIESEEELQLTLPNGRRLAIDRGSGLLISDRFPDPAAPENDLRWIRREKLTIYGAARLPEGLLPDLGDVRFDEVDGRAMLAEMREEFTREVVGQVLGEIVPVLREPARLRKKIEENRPKVAATVRELGRRSALNAGGQAISADQIERFVESVLIPVYREYRDSEANPVSFDRFLKELFEMEPSPAAGIVDRLARSRELQMKARNFEILGMTSMDVWESLEFLFEASLPPFIEGWSAGMTEAIVERIRASAAARAVDDGS